ncbi:MAG: hypothetical protein ABJL57_07900, partial [Hyphomonas sp.]
NNGKPSGNISYTCDMRDAINARLELRFHVTDHYDGKRHEYVQPIRLSFTEPHFGGKRWWMHCPANGSRAGKLYCPRGAHTFASRTAYRIGYKSQRVAGRDKPFEALFRPRLRRRLGAAHTPPQGYVGANLCTAGAGILEAGSTMWSGDGKHDVAPQSIKFSPAIPMWGHIWGHI